ncbi:carbon-nitrogen hydrolase family protein [Peptostreptococcus sp. D1]|uniref:carbon-nitrogen hydrolase family protein n=1 Tax=Peptostreptococcus sp. D1 TaxID=72304 RepID=UPI0008E40128|nr:carbon-nitrogen hydrolase family protein [Peptostreptococcus sp. D1]SFE27277.1 Predicted amidohydrolase [Peptostreptococcus sp. D1]
MKDFKVAICQMLTTDNKEKNISKAVQLIEEAARNGAALVVLPEIFNSPYDNVCFPVYAEEFPGDTSVAMMEAARNCGVYLVAGSIPEKDGGKIYNTSYFYDRHGELIGKHRKMHLFDINIEGGQYFKESDVLSPGDDFAVFDTELGKIGIGICYDIRFPEYFRVLSEKGAELIVLPAAFNMTTGPAHWEISVRMRAVDNQVYMVAASPARDENASYVSYGNSRIVDPWGSILASAHTEECIIYANVSGEKLSSIRAQLPLIKHLKRDKYGIEIK